MVGKILKNKPLREAIFELRWKLEEPEPRIKVDPHYRLLIGSLYEKVKQKYPFHEQLPTSTMPDEMAAYIVQHRFRTEENGWPLIQLGPGVLTVNETAGYIWDDFKKVISEALDAFYSSYSGIKKNLIIDKLMLRYIDAVDFDFENNAFEFLKEKMKIDVNLYEKLFEDTGISEKPLGFNFIMSFKSTKPIGVMSLRFSRGKKDNVDAIIWETLIHSMGEDAPDIKKEIMTWVNEGHELTHDWFFKIIKGDLETRFE